MTEAQASLWLPKQSPEEYEAQQKAMTEAFALVENKENWKLPIDALIDAKDRKRVEDAIIYFTGSMPYCTPAADGKLRVRAHGYYMAVGS